MTEDIKPKTIPPLPAKTVELAPKKKVSIFKLIGDFGGYLFNHKKDVSSLSKDIVALEVERARTRAEELLSIEQQQENLKKNQQQKLADEYKSIVGEHDARLKHLEQESIKPGFGVNPPAEGLKPVVRTGMNPVPTENVARVGAPLVGAQVSDQGQMVRTGTSPVPTENVARVGAPLVGAQVSVPPKPVMPTPPANPNDKKDQDLNNKKYKLAKNLLDERLKHTKQILKAKIENRVWNPYRLAQVNLIKEQRTMFFNWQHKILSMLFFVLLTSLVCVLAWGYLLVLEKEKKDTNSYIYSNLDNINKQIAVTKQELDVSIVPFNDKLMYTGYMLDNHIYWTNFFKFLEKETLRDVYYGNGMDATINGNVQGSNGLFELWSIAKNNDTLTNQAKVMMLATSSMVLSVKVDSSNSITASSTVDQPVIATSTMGGAVKFKLQLNIGQRLFLRDK